MAKNKELKGIVIEIGGDTKELSKALSDSRKDSNKLAKELRDVERLLKFDPTNTKLLAQKQQLLAEQTAEVEKRLKGMNDAMDDINDHPGDFGADQVRLLEREIISATSYVNKLKDDTKSLDKTISDIDSGDFGKLKIANFDEFSEAAKEAGVDLDGLKDKAKETAADIAKGFAAATAAVIAVGKASYDVAADFDNAFDGLLMKTGATEEEFGALQDGMEQLYAAGLGESVADVADSMAVVKNNTDLADDALISATKDALTLKDVFGYDVSETVRTASVLMKEFGLTGEQAFNMIASGSQQGLDRNGDMLDVLREYSVHFRQLGFDSEEMFTMLVSGAESGAFSVDKLGDALKEFGIRTKDGSDTSRKAFEALNLNPDEMFAAFNEGGDKAAEATLAIIRQLDTMPDSVQKTTAAVGLFGTMWEDLGENAVAAMADVANQSKLATDALENIGEIREANLSEQFQQLGREIETEVINPIGEELQPMLIEFMGEIKENLPEIKELALGVAEGFLDFATFIVDNGPLILSVIAGVGAAFGTWKIVSTAQAAVPVIKGLITLIGGAGGLTPALTMLAGMNPFVLLTAGLAGFILTNKEAREAIGEFIVDVGGALFDVGEDIVNFFFSIPDQMLQVGKDIVGGIAEGIASGASKGWSAIKDFSRSLIDKAKEELDIHSPSRAFENEVGDEVPAGAAEGVRKNTYLVTDAVADMTEAMTEEASDFEMPDFEANVKTTFGSPDMPATDRLREVINVITAYGERLIEASRHQLVLDTGVLVGETATAMDEQLGYNQILNERGV